MTNIIPLMIGTALVVAVMACSPAAGGGPSGAASATAGPSTGATTTPPGMSSDAGGQAVTPVSQALTSRVTFPANFDQMVMYGNYRRGSGGDLAYALPDTIELIKAGQPLPPGSVLILELFTNDVLSEYFVMEKGVDWGLDYGEEVRTGDWHFQQFDTSRQVSSRSNPARCMSCHGGQARNDFMFTQDRMRAYLP